MPATGIQSPPGVATILLADTANNISNSLIISSLTRVTTTATVKCYGHGLITGTYTLAGFDDAGYNGSKSITVTDADTFTFTVAGTEQTPAKGSLMSVSDPATSRIGVALRGIQVETPAAGTTLKIEKRFSAANTWVQEGVDITNATNPVTMVLWGSAVPFVRVRRSAGAGTFIAVGLTAYGA